MMPIRLKPNVGHNEYVQVTHDFSYTVRDNSNETINIKAGEEYGLVQKTNENWWYVCRLDSGSYFYIPASYVKEIHNRRSKDSDTRTLESGNSTGHSPTKPNKPPITPNKPRLSNKFSSEEEAVLTQLDSVIDAVDNIFDNSKDKDKRLSTPSELTTPAAYSEKDMKMEEKEEKMDESIEYVNLDVYQQMMKNKISKTTVAVDNPAESETSDYKSGDSKGGSRESLDSDSQGRSCDTDSIGAKEDLEKFDFPSHPESTKPKLEQLGPDLPAKPPISKTTGVKSGSSPSEYANLEDIQKSIHGKRQNENNQTDALDTKIPPPPVEQSTDLPVGWVVEQEGGEKTYINPVNSEKWRTTVDDQGRSYFYNIITKQTVWNLAEGQIAKTHQLTSDAENRIAEVEPTEDASALPALQPLPLKMVAKQGQLSKAKAEELGKKIKKPSWSQSYVVLHEHNINFFKDQKAAGGAKTKSGSSIAKPEIVLSLIDAQISMVTDEKKKEVLQLQTSNGLVYLLHNENEEALQHWKQSVENNITVLKTAPARDERELDMRLQPKPGISRLSSFVMSLGEERQKIADRLLLWLKRRPTKESLQAKGIYKEAVFGSSLKVVCERENSKIPRFIHECLVAVENRGLDVDGIYRVNGNVAAVQKLRQMVDQNEFYDLSDTSQWDIHVVTGALKLFFRELSEPLFTFPLFEEFLNAYKVQDRSQRNKRIRDAVKKLPPIHTDTMKELFKHLTEVIRHSSVNRMQTQALAIVFGPTLLWPESKDKDQTLAASMVYQGQLVEHMIIEFKAIFS